MEEVNGAALLSARLHSSWNVHASLICAVALRVCSDKMWQKKKSENREKKKKMWRTNAFIVALRLRDGGTATSWPKPSGGISAPLEKLLS